MQMTEYTRRTGKRYTYQVEYEKGQYFIRRDGMLKKSFQDPHAHGIALGEDTPEVMFKLAVGDIETLNGMEE